VTLNLKAGLNALSRAWRAVRVSVRPGGDISRRTMPPCAKRRYAHLWRHPETCQCGGHGEVRMTGFAGRFEPCGAPFDEPMERRA
jgi:hypothetical protein